MDLRTTYLGLSLRNPVVASAGPITAELDNIRRLEDLGAGAVVLPSIFEEQVNYERQWIENASAVGQDSYSEALSYFPVQSSFVVGTQRYLELIRRAAMAVEIPVIASLNGVTDHGWIEYAREIEQAGADALELNVYMVSTDPEVTGREIENRYLSILNAVKSTVAIPVSVKLSPYFSSVGQVAALLVEAGAAGLVLFNRFYQPDIDLGRLELLPSLELSRANEIRLPLLWIAVLSGRVHASLAASTGVETAEEIVKYLLAGADVVMTTSALLKRGVGYMKDLIDGLISWLAARDLDSLDRVRGRLSQRNIADPSALARANYIHVLQGYRM